MRMDLAEQLSVSTPQIALTVGAETWRVYVFGVTRVARDLFFQLALVGTRFCTATVRIEAARDRHVAAREVIALLRGWLSSSDSATHIFLESSAWTGREIRH